MIRWVRLPYRSASLGSLTLLLCATLPAQTPIRSTGGMVRIFNTDMAVLEAQDVRKDLPCSVNPGKAVLGFDLRFHTGFEVNVPLRDISGSENQLTILFRVTPEN